MKQPTRPPRNEPSLEKYTYYDHETVVQEDGRIASFGWNNKRKEEGWRFMGYKDAHKFEIWEEKDHSRMWDAETTIEQLLLESKGEMLTPFEAMKEGIQPDEIGYHYSYGGVLSGRGGIFVVKQSDPLTIIRSKMTWLS